MRISAALPPILRQPLRRARDEWQYRGQARWCPICERHSGRFVSFGLVPRADAQCPRCGSLERHRLVWLYFRHRTDLFDGKPKRMLHVAPEPCLARRLQASLGDGYVTGDLVDTSAMVTMDVTDIQFPDESFDVIYCSHVLEHVSDDRRAMREFHRVLKRGGWAVLLVPITAKRTWEDASVTSPEERLRLFGQHDHLRRYGPDYAERLEQAGFDVTATAPEEFVETGELGRFGLAGGGAGLIHFCRRRPI
jgi:SAM-dependent methyltransferase